MKSICKGGLLYLKSVLGIHWEVSLDVYKIIRRPKGMMDALNPRYKTGQRVRKIAGVDASHVPGYHFLHSWVTVCSDTTFRAGEDAEYVGFPEDCLERVMSIYHPENLTQRQMKYWMALAQKMRNEVTVVDPWRVDLKELREAYPKGTKVYRASTGGKWGKSAAIVTL